MLYLCLNIDVGNSGVRRDLVAKSAFDAVMKFDARMSTQPTSRHLGNVRFVNVDSEVTKCFQKTFGEMLQKRNNSSRNGRTCSSSVDKVGERAQDTGYNRPIGNSASSATRALDRLTTPLANLKVEILVGNLIQQRTDAIVSPANCHLVHSGGAARAIAEAAGYVLESECIEYMRTRRRLEVGQVMHTTSGRLGPSILYVIHAVGPNVKDIPDIKICERLVYDSFLNCLLHANNALNIESISIPAISSGRISYINIYI